MVADAELTEVKQEVRQHTLLDAQVARISALLEDPRFDEAWVAQLDRELASLASLDGAAAVKTALLGEVRETFVVGIRDSLHLQDALARFAAGQQHVDLGEDADRALQTLAARRLDAVLDAAAANPVWIAELRSELEYLHDVMPQARGVALLKLEAADVIADVLRQAVDGGNLKAARELMRQLEILEFDRVTVETSRALLADADEFVVPGVHPDLTTKTVLAMDRLRGVPLEDLCGAGADPGERDRAATRLLRLVLREFFEFRFLQSDPNFANYLLLPDGRIGLIDLGAGYEAPRLLCERYARLFRAAWEDDRLEEALKQSATAWSDWLGGSAALDTAPARGRKRHAAE